MNLAITSAILGLILIAGKIFDNYTYNGEKTAIFKKIEKIGKTIEDTKMPNIFELIIDKTISIFVQISTFKTKPVHSILKIILISWILTSAFTIFGFFNGNHIQGVTLENFRWHDYLPYYPFYFINFPFDLGTIIISIFIFKYIKSKNILTQILGIFFNLVIAFLLGWFSHIAIDTYSHREPTNNLQFIRDDVIWIEGSPSIKISEKTNIVNYINHGSAKNLISLDELSDSTYAVIKTHKYLSLSEYSSNVLSYISHKKNILEYNRKLFLYNEDKKREFDINISIKKSWAFVGMSLSTFYPLIIFLSTMVIILVSKQVFYFSKLITTRLLKTSIQNVDEKDIKSFKPGAHFSIVIALIIALIKLIEEIIS